MFKPKSGPFENHIFLFHDPENNPYGDVVGPETIEYVGEGQTGDQHLRSFNLYLAEHLARGLKVHFFKKEEPGRLRYEGEVICAHHERVWRDEEQRSVLRFSLVRAAPVFDQGETVAEPLVEYSRARAEILTRNAEPRLIDRPTRFSIAQRLVRDVAFRDVVLGAYKKVCAVCGPPLRRDSYIDLQAAHIVGVAGRGPDDPRNGLSLCHRHHWAFDHGVFALSDELRVMPLVDEADPHGELREGEAILVPSDATLAPHTPFVALHRAKWASG